jgi:hypothetical protein
MEKRTVVFCCCCCCCLSLWSLYMLDQKGLFAGWVFHSLLFCVELLCRSYLQTAPRNWSQGDPEPHWIIPCTRGVLSVLFCFGKIPEQKLLSTNLCPSRTVQQSKQGSVCWFCNVHSSYWSCVPWPHRSLSYHLHLCSHTACPSPLTRVWAAALSSMCITAYASYYPTW